MKVRFRSLAVLVAVPVLVALSYTGRFSGQAQVQTCGNVQPDVLQALTTEMEVSVIISLQLPPAPLEELSIPEIAQHTAEQQAGVLAEVGVLDFALTYQYLVAPALAGRITVSGADALDCHPAVTSIHLDRDLSVSLSESVPLIHGNDPEILQEGLDGTGVDVAVIDTGIDTDHPDLLDSIIGEECFRECDNGTNRQSGPGSAEDDNGHGTHVSGIITSNGVTPGIPVGVAPNADIFAYKVFDSEGRGSMSAVFAALDHILFYHAGEFEFINMSLEIEIGLPQQDCELAFGQSPVTTIELLRAGGTLSFAASGNNVRKDALAYPACVAAVVSVGGVYDADIGEAWWKPQGVFLCSDAATAPDKVICFSDSADYLDLLAPGSEILSTWPFIYAVALRSGTSQAAPHAVGVAALLKQALPWLTPPEVLVRMKSAGAWLYDDLALRWTQRVDARVALLPDAKDYDQDGCSNVEELGSDESLGGLRNPLDFWDFYDTPNQYNERDKIVDLVDDIMDVAMRYHASGDPSGDPLAGPIPPPPAYHPAFDRSGIVGPNVWNLGPADGYIDLTTDILPVSYQYHHSCVAPP